MNIIRLSYRNMINRPLGTTLSLILLTLGVGMIALLMQVNRQIQEQMKNNVRDIDMVVGAKGSPLQLILSAVYHIDDPTGNISLAEAQKLQKNRLISKAIPLSYGDNFRGYRIVGTNYDYPTHYNATVSEGKLWEDAFEATIGASLARDLELKLGDEFESSHGLKAGGETHGEQKYEVVGIFEQSNSVLDQLILTNVESIWKAHGDHEAHDHEHDGEEEHVHEEDRQITAMLIEFRSPVGIVQLPRMINERTNMQAAVPSYEISRLFKLMGVGLDTLRAIALMIMILSALSVFVSLYNALKDREYEMALMRTYGASRWQLVWLVLQEGLLLSLSGFILGIIFSRIGLWLVSKLIKMSYHYDVSAMVWTAEETALLFISIGIGLVAALIPAVRAFNVNISKTLADA